MFSQQQRSKVLEEKSSTHSKYLKIIQDMVAKLQLVHASIQDRASRTMHPSRTVHPGPCIHPGPSIHPGPCIRPETLVSGRMVLLLGSSLLPGLKALISSFRKALINTPHPPILPRLSIPHLFGRKTPDQHKCHIQDPELSFWIS